MKIIRSDLLSECAGIVHGFVHDAGGPDVAGIAGGHGLDHILTVKQVHGAGIFFADGRVGDETVCADSIVVREKGIGAGVVTADCVPIVLCVPDLGCVCAVHAGWRGTFLRIARETVLSVRSNYSCEGSDIFAAIGPAIGRCCYEVRDDLASQFASRFGEGGSWLCEKGGGKFLLDLVELNRIELRDAGVSGIDVTDVCTCCGGLPSYRRDGSSAGRMLSFAGIPD